MVGAGCHAGGAEIVVEGGSGVIGEVWQLRRRDDVVGEITISDADFPWLAGTFVALPGFAEVAPLFAEELELTRRIEDDDSKATVEEWEAVHRRIATMLTLVAPSGPVAEFLLHIDGSDAWFRWSDEPFDVD